MPNIKPKQLTGKCLCGKVTITATPIDKMINACHCASCRRWASGPLFGIISNTSVKYTGQQYIKSFSAPAERIERGHCNHCGTKLYFYRKDTQQTVLPIALFENTEHYTLHHEIYIDHKPDYYDLSDKTLTITSQEMQEYFAMDNHADQTHPTSEVSAKQAAG